MWPSLDDLQDIIRVSYKTINGRIITTLQQPDVLALLSIDCFLAFYVFIVRELFELDPDRQSKDYTRVPEATLTKILEDAKARGYLDFRPLANDKKPPVRDRCSILYEVLIDLQANRIKSGKTVYDDLKVIPRCEELEEEQKAKLEETLSQVETAVGTKTDSKQSLNQRLVDIVASAEPKWKEINAKFKGSFPYLLIPNLKKRINDIDKLLKLVDEVQSEYASRLSVMLMRLDVTAQAFLYSDRAKASYDEVCSLLSALNAWVDDYKSRNALSIYDLISADRRLMAPMRISSRNIPSALKKIQVGDVPNRGGVPEGFAALDVNRDVQKANVALQQKDARELQAKKRAETEWIGGAAATATVVASKKSLWKAPAGESKASKFAEQQGGIYHGFSEGYERSGRKRFPGFDPREALGALSQDLPYIAEPRQPRVAPAPTIAQSSRLIYMEAEPATAPHASHWGGRQQDQSYTGWNPRHYQ